MIFALPLVTSAISSVLGSSQAASTVSSAAQTSATSGAGSSFTDMLSSFSKDTVDKLKTSETMSVAGIEGKATTQSVVESVIAAQESLQTALAVRDKAVSAFQEISRMTI